MLWNADVRVVHANKGVENYVPNGTDLTFTPPQDDWWAEAADVYGALPSLAASTP
jgi:hypothetical protein